MYLKGHSHKVRDIWTQFKCFQKRSSWISLAKCLLEQGFQHLKKQMSLKTQCPASQYPTSATNPCSTSSTSQCPDFYNRECPTCQCSTHTTSLIFLTRPCSASWTSLVMHLELSMSSVADKTIYYLFNQLKLYNLIKPVPYYILSSVLLYLEQCLTISWAVSHHILNSVLPHLEQCLSIYRAVSYYI